MSKHSDVTIKKTRFGNAPGFQAEAEERSALSESGVFARK